MTGFPQLKAVSMRDSVGQAIRQALTDRRFQPGESLSEAGLAAEMGISRGPVREALLLLVQEGLVTHSPNRGFSVINFNREDIREINVVRLPLETTALSLALTHISEEDLKELEDLNRKIVNAYVSQQFVLCGQSDMAFHNLIWARTGNVRLCSTLRTLLSPFFAYGSLFAANRPELTPELLDEEHGCFVRFLRGSTERTAEDCVRFHLGVPFPCQQ
jgi:DNA-binding GntR family transcriptional regulator